MEGIAVAQQKIGIQSGIIAIEGTSAINPEDEERPREITTGDAAARNVTPRNIRRASECSPALVY